MQVFAIVSLICGILSIVLCCLGVFSALAGLAGIMFGVIALIERYDGKRMAIAGIVTGGIGIFLWIALIASGVLLSIAENL